jgi:hypothetical protein
VNKHGVVHKKDLFGNYRNPSIYPIPLTYMEKAKQRIHDMIDQGILRPSSSHFTSPVVCRPKKDGSLRLCVDFRAVNAVTIPDKYSIPNINTIKHLIKRKIFSCLDLKEGFNQIPVHEDDISKTAISTPWGLFEYTRMPFGLINATATFQRFMNTCLHGITNICIYVDDIIVFTQDVETHEKILRELFTRFQKYGLLINVKKSEFFLSSCTFLGYEFVDGGYRAKECIVPQLDKIPVPETRKQLLAFIGVTGYYRSHVPNYASIAIPLYTLSTGRGKFRWATEHQ